LDRQRRLTFQAIHALGGVGDGVQAGFADGRAAGGAFPIGAAVDTLYRRLDLIDLAQRRLAEAFQNLIALCLDRVFGEIGIGSFFQFGVDLTRRLHQFGDAGLEPLFGFFGVGHGSLLRRNGRPFLSYIYARKTLPAT
jgi:hypothetical protein